MKKFKNVKNFIKNLKRCLIKGPQEYLKRFVIKDSSSILKNSFLRALIKNLVQKYIKKVPY